MTGERGRRVTRVQIVELLEIDDGFVEELEAASIICADDEGHYDHGCVDRVRLSWTLSRSLGVNLEGVEVVLDLLERWQAERRRTHELLVRLRAELDSRSS